MRILITENLENETNWNNIVQYILYYNLALVNPTTLKLYIMISTVNAYTR